MTWQLSYASNSSVAAVWCVQSCQKVDNGQQLNTQIFWKTSIVTAPELLQILSSLPHHVLPQSSTFCGNNQRMPHLGIFHPWEAGQHRIHVNKWQRGKINFWLDRLVDGHNSIQNLALWFGGGTLISLWARRSVRLKMPLSISVQVNAEFLMQSAMIQQEILKNSPF